MRVAFDAMGLTVEVVCPSEAVGARIAEEWAWCGATTRTTAPSDEQVATFEVTGDERSRYALATAVTMQAIGHFAGQRLMLHAAGLADDDGAVVVVIGGSGSGKTTAAAELCREVFGYVSDEVIAVTATGNVQAYPKPLSQISTDDRGQHKRQASPDELSLRRPPTNLSVGPFVILDRQPGVERATLTRLTLADAVLAVIPQTSFLAEMDRPLQQLCAQLSRQGAFRLRYSEVRDTADLLRGLPSNTAEPAEWEPVDVAGDVFALRDGRFRRGPVADAVVVEEELLLLVERTPMRIAGVGRTLWDALADGSATSEDLLRISVDSHGAHPRAAALVQQASTSMVWAGALTRHLPLTLGQVMAGESADEVGLLSAGPPNESG
jgi:hypothetical protein